MGWAMTMKFFLHKISDFSKIKLSGLVFLSFPAIFRLSGGFVGGIV